MRQARQFSIEEASDIRVMYRDAKHPEAQIGVMAQLYACEKDDIRQVLGLIERAAKPPREPARREYRKYDDKTKQAVVAAVLDEGVTPKKAAAAFGVAHTSISPWVVKERKRRAQAASEATETLAVSTPLPPPPVTVQQKTIRFIMKSGAMFDVRCTGFRVKKTASGKFERYIFEEAQSQPIFINHYDVAAIIEVSAEGATE